MRWCLFAIGSRGDVQPFLALGRALLARGHEVRLATLEPQAALVRAQGLEHASLGPLPERYVGTGAPDLRFTGLGGRALFWASYRQLLARYLERFVEAADGAEGLIFSGLAFPLYHLAEGRGIPAVSVSLVPHYPSRAFADPFFADHPLAGWAPFNAWSARAERGLMLELTAGPVQRWRREALGLPPVPRGRLAAHRASVITRELLACSEHLLPACEDRPPDLEVTGLFELDEEPGWSPDPELRAFMEGGPPPLLVSFGSMTRRAAGRRFRATFGAIRALGERAIVLGERAPEELLGFAREAGLPRERVLAREAAPHAWLMPRIKLALHHGGIGTLAAATRAGRPSVVLPQGYDQRFWAERVERLGIGRGWLGRGWLGGGSPDRGWIEGALLEAGSEAARARAEALGRLIAAEKGAEVAADLLTAIRPRSER